MVEMVAEANWFSQSVKNHVVAWIVGGGLSAAATVIGFAGLMYMDLRHVQREEHTASLNALALERRCDRYHEQIDSFTLRMAAINREEQRLRNYNGRANAQTNSPVSYLIQAREDTIADLGGERASLVVALGQLKPPPGCEG